MEVIMGIYATHANAFQTAKIRAAATDAGTEYTAARKGLKAFCGAKDFLSFIQKYVGNPVARAKIEKKSAEWERKGVIADPIYDPKACIDALGRFQTAFLASTQNQVVMNARQAKKVFKLATFERFQAGETVEALQAQIAGLSEQTVAKIADWKSRYDGLVQSGQLPAKMDALRQAIQA